ncbi:22333_t:CDS:2, partial [Entrophospora sp. SA101]
MQALKVGVLALQGAFLEHINILKRLPEVSSVIAIRNLEQLNSIDALIIPGGESTTMALIAERAGLWESLKEFVHTKPTWGTCAGMILLANEVFRTKAGGQNLLGGLDITIDSFESFLDIKQISNPSHPFPALFIRAPIISSINSSDVEILASLNHNNDDVDTSTVVAVKQGHIIATAFHPELTHDDRIH